MDNASKKDNYKIGTILIPDMENYGKIITMGELITERTSHIPFYDIRGGYPDCIGCPNGNKKCGCGGC